MFGSEILDVAIGVMFVYLLLSLICSTTTEFISGIFALRSNNLEKGIRNLLGDPQNSGFAKDLYEHPLISNLCAKHRWFFWVKKKAKPSYIPSRSFALSLLDIIAPTDAEKPPKVLIDVRKAVSNIQNDEVKKALLPLIDDAGSELKDFRQSIEYWFDGAMDRVAGWYKRKAQLIVIALAFIVSFGLNVDTIRIADSLFTDTTLRSSVVAAASQSSFLQSDSEQEAGLEQVSQLQVELAKLKLPIGWKDLEDNGEDDDFDYLQLIGLLITAIAVSLGAPFWFEALNKVVSLRTVGKESKKNNSA